MQQAQNSSPLGIPANARDEGHVPIIAPMQIFVLVAPDAPENVKDLQVNSGFYRVLLATDEGLAYTIDKSSDCLFQGTPMNTTLKDTHRILLKTPIGPQEKKDLHTLGALSALFVLVAEVMPMLQLMPMQFQQTMQFCQVNCHLVPLSQQQLLEARNACGILVKQGVIDVCSNNQVDPGKVLNNMTLMYESARDVVGPKPLHVTGGPFADSMMLTFGQ